jgi:hypothetical protein
MWLAAACMAIAACTPEVEVPVDRNRGETLPPEPSLSEQVAAVKTGQSQIIELRRTDVTLKELDSLAGLDGLRELVLTRSQFGDEGLATIAQYAPPELERLVLGDVDATDAGLARLAPLKNLKALNLGTTRVTDDGLAHLAEMTSLELLRLGSSQITDAGMTHLQGHAELKYLILQNAQLTDAGLEQLTGLVKLESLFVEGNRITEAGVRKSFPNLHVHWEWGGHSH